MENYFTNEQDKDVLEWLRNVEQDPKWWELSRQQQLNIINNARIQRATADFLSELGREPILFQSSAPDWLMDLRYRQPTIFASSAPDVPISTRPGAYGQFQPSLSYDPVPSEPFQPQVTEILREAFPRRESVPSEPFEPEQPFYGTQFHNTRLCPQCRHFYKITNLGMHMEREQNYLDAGLLLNIQGGKWWCIPCNKSFDTFLGYAKHNCVDDLFHVVKKRFTK